MSDLPSAKLVELVPLGLAVADHDDLVLASHLEGRGPVRVRVDNEEGVCRRRPLFDLCFPKMSEENRKVPTLLSVTTSSNSRNLSNQMNAEMGEYEIQRSANSLLPQRLKMGKKDSLINGGKIGV